MNVLTPDIVVARLLDELAHAHVFDHAPAQWADGLLTHRCYPPRSTVHDYLDLWSYDGTLDRIHHALASPTAAIIDSQSVKSAEKGGPVSIRMALMRARRSKARSATFL